MAIEKSCIEMLKKRHAKIEALKELLKLAHESLDSKDVEIAELKKELDKHHKSKEKYVNKTIEGNRKRWAEDRNL